MTPIQFLLVFANGSIWTVVFQTLWRFAFGPRPIKIDDDEPPTGIGA